MERSTIERFVNGGQVLREAVTGLTDGDLDARPGPGKWSIRELVLHLVDMDAIALDRMKRVIAEDNPTLLSADENRYIERLCYGQQDLDDALAYFEIGRRQMGRVLGALDAATFQRFGTHNVAGKVTLSRLVVSYCDHLDHHLKFLHGKLERMGKGK